MEVKNIAVLAPFTSISGYGQYGRNIASCIIKQYGNLENYKVFLFDVGGGSINELQKFNLENSTFFKNLLEFITPLDQLQKEFFDVCLTVSVPQAFAQKGLYNIGVTALAEADKVHPNLIQHCNRMDEVWVMSEYNVNTLKNSVFVLRQNEQKVQVNIPIKVVPPFFPMNQKDAQEKPLNITDITNYIDDIPQSFLFVSVGTWLPGSVGNDRKDIGALISGFIKAFPNNKDIGLLLKVDQGRSSILSEYSMRQKINQIYDGLGEKCINNNIYFISGNLTQEQMQEIYVHDKVKTYLSFTHGQSFGIPIMEFQGLTGKPLLVPYHSGMVQYLKPEYVEILIHKEVNVPQQLFRTFMRDFFVPESKWYTVDYQYAIFKMAELIKNYDSLKKRSELQREHIIQEFNIDKVSLKIKELLDEHLVQDDTME